MQIWLSEPDKYFNMRNYSDQGYYQYCLQRQIMVRTTSDIQISRNYQGQTTVFKDCELFNKSAFFNTLSNTSCMAKTLHGVIYDFNFFSHG